MRIYQVYLIEDEFATHYFGRERMFFQLFDEYKNAKGELRKILEKQIDYITKSIPNLRLHQYIYQQLQRKKDFRIENGIYYIENRKQGSAKLELFEKALLLQSFGSYEAETLFFEVLRKSETSFIAIDLENKRYGWLRPIKERKFV
ncbi:sporulation inhibitor of replication protein SirA [Bacillus massilinigeriensis]|uniref:sporulation inhibitor of replication protein SirA n=1 Tax=Bacillus massilionigeriensis TaxID=1805475 RepID=UPI00096ADB1F|nr:sporulation inhibitor of replication protein SirA [Bacillus massilionigeriensis]